MTAQDSATKLEALLKNYLAKKDLLCDVETLLSKQ